MQLLGGMMNRPKVARAVVACMGLMSLAGASDRLPFFFHLSNNGEMSAINLLCTLIGFFCLLVGALRFLLSGNAKGTPFVLAFFAFVPALIRFPLSILSMWFVAMAIASIVGALVGFGVFGDQAASDG